MHGINTWLKNIASSSVIVTNSFHCMAVALILNKKFIVVPTFPGREKRMVSLLSLMGCDEQFFVSLNDLKNRLDAIRDLNISVDSLNAKLSELRKESEEFIEEKIIN